VLCAGHGAFAEIATANMPPSTFADPVAVPSNDNGKGIALPAPPPSTSIALDASQLAAQAEEAAMQAQAKAEIVQNKREQEHMAKSYDRASAGLIPLTSDQVREFMRKAESNQAAAVPPATGTPKAQVRLATLPLDPGVEPPQVNLVAGYVTTITIVDASGATWPITDVGVGGSFEVTPTTSGSHVVRIMPLTRYGAGNLSVLLKDLPTPIIFRLAVGGPTVDMRYDARIPKLGPNARPPLIDRPKLEAGDKDIVMILDNAPPQGAKRMKVSGLDARTMVWDMGGKVFVRTPLTLLSPSWDASVASADGMKVYEIGDAPVLLMSDNGVMVRGRLSREDERD
jgi:intracellular multiplication protein IcmK